MYKKWHLLALLLLLPTSSQAQLPPPDPAPAPVPSDDALEGSGAVIGEIRIEVQDVFDPEDPKEDRAVYRLANRLHRTTRDQVIAEQLLFKPGDRYSRRVLDESERLLRGDRYLYDAEIRPIRYADGKVDLEVVARDVWTLNAGLGLGHSGGASSTHFQVQDTNLLGTGKSLTLERSTTVDRSSSLVRYDDPELFGSRFQLRLGFSSNSDGGEREINLVRPFYSLDSRWSAGLTARTDDQVESHYELGAITDRFRHQQDHFELRGGLSNGLHDGWARRWTAGFTFLRDRFSPAEGFDDPSLLPGDRTLSYPWIGFDLVQDDYEKARNLDQIHRTEDLFLGGQAHLRLGFSSPVFGGDQNRAVFDATASHGFHLTEDQTLLLSSGLTGRWGKDGAEDALLDAGVRYYWRDFGEHLFFATLEGSVAENPDPDHQLLLGGDSGLRGYPLRYQDGDRRVLLTLEQRFFTHWYPLHLVHVGAAVFFDAGRTWSDLPGDRNLGLLKDVGVGLRLGSSRSALGQVIHIDLAFPLDGPADLKRTQWLVTTKAGF
jgi:Omp85 superfamily domain